jgi:uncharacterized protein YndB with AHSA1/START domain
MNLIEVTVSRTIPASAEKVFDMWMNPKGPGGPWFGVERLIFNPTVDGLFYSLVKQQDSEHPHYGRFIRIERPYHIEHTWMSKGTKGEESVVNITLEPRGDDTEMTIRHSGLPDDEVGRRHKDGWGWILDMLAQGLAARRSASSQ